MIRRMVYVACDDCGDPAGGNDQMGDDAAEARQRARGVGFVRIAEAGQRIDLCPRCMNRRKPRESETEQ